MPTGDFLTSQDEAFDFINRYGVVTLFPVKGTEFPSLYNATKGSRDEKFRDAWVWADNLASGKQIHYGKLVCKQVTLVSLEMFPYFYRLSKERKLTSTARKILSFLESNGKTSTTGLRESLGFKQKEKKYEFLKAIDELQMAFAIAIVDREKPPRLTHIYDIMERWMPGSVLKRAEPIGKDVARKKIIAKLLESKAISRVEDAKRFLLELQQTVPQIKKSTHILVGFPGESEDDFMDSVKVVKNLRPNILNITRFSARPKTEAMDMEDKIPSRIAKERSRELTKIHTEISRVINKGFLGRKERILITEHGKNGTMMGRTDNYLPVVVEDEVEICDFVDVK